MSHDADLQPPLTGPLTPDQREPFEEVCRYTREAFQDAIDLVLIHNETQVRGDQPRTSLNPLIVLLAVAGWERFILEVRAAALHTASAQWIVGTARPRPRGGQARYSNAVTEVLAPLSGGALPQSWQVRVFTRWKGASPQSARLCSGADPELEQHVNEWINLRNRVAHRCLPQDGAPFWSSDADAHTIQAGEARIALAELVQLVDQAIVAISSAAGFDRARLRLPAGWFTSTPPARFRGYTRPGALWGGHPLQRPAPSR